MSIQKIHHINFLVKDLDTAIEKYSAILGTHEFVKDDLAGRGVKTARVALGEQWLVLVQPVDPNSVPGQYLEKNGEGFFLLSFAVNGMEKTVESLSESGINTTSETDRKGLLNWWVRDIDLKETFGAQLQMCEERD